MSEMGIVFVLSRWSGGSLGTYGAKLPLGPVLRDAVEARRVRLAADGAPAGADAAARAAAHQAVGAAYVTGFRLAMLAAAGLALAGAFAAGWLVEGKDRGARRGV